MDLHNRIASMLTKDFLSSHDSKLIEFSWTSAFSARVYMLLSKKLLTQRVYNHFLYRSICINLELGSKFFMSGSLKQTAPFMVRLLLEHRELLVDCAILWSENSRFTRNFLHPKYERLPKPRLLSRGGRIVLLLQREKDKRKIKKMKRY